MDKDKDCDVKQKEETCCDKWLRGAFIYHYNSSMWVGDYKHYHIKFCPECGKSMDTGETERKEEIQLHLSKLIDLIGEKESIIIEPSKGTCGEETCEKS